MARPRRGCFALQSLEDEGCPRARSRDACPAPPQASRRVLCGSRLRHPLRAVFRHAWLIVQRAPRRVTRGDIAQPIVTTLAGRQARHIETRSIGGAASRSHAGQGRAQLLASDPASCARAENSEAWACPWVGLFPTCFSLREGELNAASPEVDERGSSLAANGTARFPGCHLDNRSWRYLTSPAGSVVSVGSH